MRDFGSGPKPGLWRTPWVHTPTSHNDILSRFNDLCVCSVGGESVWGQWWIGRSRDPGVCQQRTPAPASRRHSGHVLLQGRGKRNGIVYNITVLLSFMRLHCLLLVSFICWYFHNLLSPWCWHHDCGRGQRVGPMALIGSAALIAIFSSQCCFDAVG